jgi:murein DD-endopeptidase MepM/ murein hydrolase activator NlpD
VKLGGRLAAVLLACLLVAPVLPAGAGELDRLREGYDEAAAEEAGLLARYEQSRARTNELDVQVAGLDRQVAAVGAEVAAAEARLAAAEARRKAAFPRLVRVRRELLAAVDELHDQAVAAYMGSDTNQLTGLLLKSETVRQVTLTASYAGALATNQERVIARHEVLEAKVEKGAKALEQDRVKAAAERDQLAARKAELDGARAQLAQVRAAAASEVATQSALLDQVRARKAEYERRLAALQSDSDTIGALLRRLQAGQPVVPRGDGSLSMPISGARLSSMFGWRVHPIFGTRRLHAGVDLSAGTGTPIRAADDGFVVWADWRGGYGLATVIDHGGALATLYGHQSRQIVRAGQTVSRGQVIGYVGSTGFSTGPHLHFETRILGTPVDPLGYL